MQSGLSSAFFLGFVCIAIGCGGRSSEKTDTSVSPAVDTQAETATESRLQDRAADTAVTPPSVDAVPVISSDGMQDLGVAKWDGDARIDGVNLSDVHAASTAELWSVRMANSVLRRYPNATRLNSTGSPSWNYTQGFTLYALDAVYQKTSNRNYWDYISAYYDGLIDGFGKIGGGYSMDEYNLDLIMPGRALRIVLAESAKEKFQKALQSLRSQLRNQPRNGLGGFWHKKRYPNQMWLDSVYMGPLFLLEHGQDTGDESAVDEAILQFTLLQEHARDPKTGLYFHGWDESRKEKWSHPETGTSASFWGRGMGWYAMALVDGLEILPDTHPKRPILLSLLTQVLTAVRHVTDPQSQVWYQVLDQGARDGNYLESSASCMFCYTFLKSARLGYVDVTYREQGLQAFEGILKQFIRVESSGDVTITNGCLGAGLGPDPLTGKYRDGSFTYYVTERKGDNATQAVPAFILASIEYELLKASPPPSK